MDIRLPLRVLFTMVIVHGSRPTRLGTLPVVSTTQAHISVRTKGAPFVLRILSPSPSHTRLSVILPHIVEIEANL